MTMQQQEIAELKQALLKAQEDIERLSKVKSDFVSIISHELRTPLTSIKEGISIVLDGVAGSLNEEQKKFLGIAKNNIDRLTRIITDILDFSKLESGRIAMHKRKMDINEIIKDVYGEIKTGIDKKGLGLDMELSDEVGLTWLDPDRIKQALKNLLSNAIKFNRERGNIKISSSRERTDNRDFIKVTVEDTGMGISKDDLPKLFKDFYPLDSSMTRSYGGVGLGLAISRSIIKLHGGDIWAESEKEVGSRFSFTLPIYKKDDEFNFLLDEAIERAESNDMELVLIVLKPRVQKGVNEEVLSQLETAVQSTVRGPEDKVVRFKDGDLVAIIAGTDREGAKRIIERLSNNVKISLNFGISVYPEDTCYKADLVKMAEEELKSGRNII
jgi:nitrogen-specific signal transduction histidine kinase